MIPPITANLLCSCSRNLRTLLSDPLNKNHALSCQQGEQINRHDDIAKTLEKVVLYYGGDNGQSVYVPNLVGINRFNNGYRTFKGDLPLCISQLNGTIENFNVDISVINQSSRSNCVRNIDSVLKAREDLKEHHYRQVVNNAGFNRLVPFVILNSGALGDKAKEFPNNFLISRLDPLGEIGIVKK